MRLKSAAALVLTLLLFAGSKCLGADRIEASGDLLQIGLPIAAFGAALAQGDGEGAIQFAKAGALTEIVTQALKFTIDKKRPDGHSQAFPSGHTSISFASAQFLQERYGAAYGIPAYALATFVGWSRIHAKRHDLIDATAGALLGMGLSHYFTTPFGEARVGAYGGDREAGVEVSLRW